MTLRIGIVGGYQVGKTTLGNYLNSKHGFGHYQLANPLKVATTALYPSKASIINAPNKTEEARALLNKVSLGYKNRLGEDCYAKLITTVMDSTQDVVVSDVRFMAEANHLIHKGFVLVAIGMEFGGYDIKIIKEDLCKVHLPAKPPSNFVDICLVRLRNNYDI